MSAVSLGQTKAVIGFHDGSGRSLQSFVPYQIDGRVPVSWQPASLLKQTNVDGPYRGQYSGEKPAFLQNLAFHLLRRLLLLLRQCSEVVSLSTKLSHLMRGQCYVAFYNVLDAVADAVHEFPVAFANVLQIILHPAFHIVALLVNFRLSSSAFVVVFGSLKILLIFLDQHSLVL